MDRGLYDSWVRIRDTFRPNTVAAWHDTAALEWCAKWMGQGPGIVWTEHSLFAERLSRETGHPYFGPEGLDAQGGPIEGAHGPVIASVQANGTGRNLQRWHRNLITAPSPLAATWEQLLGRTHREGQAADDVEVDVLLGCQEHGDAWVRALSGAQAAVDTMGDTQKILVGEKLMPQTNIRGHRWNKA